MESIDEEIKFCSRHCVVMFDGLEKKGRMKAAIMAERKPGRA